MANRVLDAEVRLVISDTSIADLTPFITASNVLVNRVSLNCGDLSNGELSQIEIYLSAHFAAVSDPSLALKSEKFENAANTYSRGAGDKNGILSTQYGQMANTLSNGCLVELDLMKPSFFAAGSDCV